MNPLRYSSNKEIFTDSGIYVPNDDRWPVHFRGIGIRIEDSVCVDDEHPYVLTTEAVKEVFIFFSLINCINISVLALHV